MSANIVSVIERALIDRAIARAAVPFPMAHPDAKVRHSDAGKCSRAIAYRMVGAEPEPMDEAGAWVTYLGSLVHERWQQAILEDIELFGDDQLLVEEKVFVPEIPSAGHCDLVYRTADTVQVHELKTVNGTGYRLITEPKPEHLLQAGLNAWGVGAHPDEPEIVITYLAMEAVSRVNARKLGLDGTQRYVKTYRYQWHQVLPLVEREIARLRTIVEMVETDGVRFVMRIVPGSGLVVDPANGKLDGGGRVWQCDYCPFQQQCVTDNGFGT